MLSQVFVLLSGLPSHSWRRTSQTHTPSVDEVAVWLSWDPALGFFVWEGTGSFKGCVLGEKPILHSAVLISCHKLFFTLVFSIFGGCHPVIKRWAALSLIAKPWLSREPPASALDHWSWGRWQLSASLGHSHWLPPSSVAHRVHAAAAVKCEALGSRQI